METPATPGLDRHMDTPTRGTTIRLRFSSTFEMLELVQSVTDHVGRLLAFEEDAMVWMEVAVRESVVNAIKHGNRHDPAKLVHIDYSMVPAAVPEQLVIAIRDEGEGFDPESLPDPLAPENILKSSGRGIFFMRSFMDDVQIARHPEGGMEVRLLKNLPVRAN
jgi:serine/threonine-protein kinase RsbW